LLNIEGLGRQLDPELDLWKTAKPILEKWMARQVGWEGWQERLRKEAPRWATLAPQLPRLVHTVLSQRVHSGEQQYKQEKLLRQLLQEQRHTNHVLGMLLAFAVGVTLGVAAVLVWLY
jgi:ubiquinone biosynthesis protein